MRSPYTQGRQRDGNLSDALSHGAKVCMSYHHQVTAGRSPAWRQVQRLGPGLWAWVTVQATCGGLGPAATLPLLSQPFLQVLLLLFLFSLLWAALNFSAWLFLPNGTLCLQSQCLGRRSHPGLVGRVNSGQLFTLILNFLGFVRLSQILNAILMQLFCV